MTEVRVKVSPGAKEDAIVGWQDNILRVRVRAKPERGKANEAVRRLVAAAAGVPASAVSIARGLTSREKLIRMDGLDNQEFQRRLGLTPGESQSGIMKEL
jgi:uncharacterized protein (TIGR00251 family)